MNYIVLRDLAEEFGVTQSNARKWILKNGFKPLRVRTEDSRSQLTLAFTPEEAKTVREHRRLQGFKVVEKLLSHNDIKPINIEEGEVKSMKEVEPMKEEYVGVVETARRFGVSDGTIRKVIQTNDIVIYKRPGSVKQYIHQSDINKLEHYFQFRPISSETISCPFRVMARAFCQ